MPLHSRRTALALAAAGAAGLIGLPAVAAQAADYPSWADILRARGDVKAKQRAIADIKARLEQSRSAAAAAQKKAEEAGTAYQAARDRVDAAASRIAAIGKQVAADDARAEEATRRAAALAAQLTRTGGTDPETTLFFSAGDGGDPQQFLAKLGRLSKLTQSNSRIADDAQAARDTAAATQRQLQEAKDQLVDLQDRAKAAYTTAVQANEAANALVQRQEKDQIQLEARLRALEAKSESLARARQAGIAAALRATSAGAGGVVVSSGWAKPAYGPITAGFGLRPDRPAGAQLFHHGTDIGAGYGSPIYAAHAGTVTYAGWFGTYGYWIEVDDGDGTQTGYAHIRPGGIFVHVGESVSAGQNIASVGATGAATGPHLHFETREHEVAVDAVPFMAARGVPLG